MYLNKIMILKKNILFLVLKISYLYLIMILIYIYIYIYIKTIMIFFVLKIS